MTPARAPLLLALLALVACPHDFVLPSLEAGAADAPVGHDRAALEGVRPADRLAPDTVCSSPCVTTFAGRCGSGGVDDGGSLAEARFSFPRGMALEPGGAVLVADSGNRRIRRIAGGQVTTVFASTQFGAVSGVAFDSGGELVVSDAGKDRLFWISGGTISKTAGSQYGFADGPLATALFDGPRALVFDAALGLLVADSNNRRVRLVKEGQVQTFAGLGSGGCQDGELLQARFESVSDVTLGADGTIYVADRGCSAVRKIAGGQTTMVKPLGFTGWSDGVAVDSKGVVYVSDSEHHIIRRVVGDQVTILAGNGEPGFRDGPAATAQFHAPERMLVDASDALLVADTFNSCIRMIR
jgi:sugar lactone lactonase YvrE